MRGKCQGIRTATCYGNILFKRDAEDQNFIDTLDQHWRRWWQRILLWLWARIDYGRSMLRVALFATILSFLFGLFYYWDWSRGLKMMNYSRSADSALTPFYYSVVTYTTLGFGDVTPKHWLGEVVVMAEVIAGYLTLGLLVAILANKVARRA